MTNGQLIGQRMDGDGPFLFLSPRGPRRGFAGPPRGGMCVSAFLFLVQGGKLLLGKYADDPRWEEMTGMDESRWRQHGRGWTVPGTHLKFGEEPRAAAERIAREMLRVEPPAARLLGVESDLWTYERTAEHGEHYDLWLLYEAELARDAKIEKPAWYRELAFHDPRALAASEYARGHEDVVARWLDPRA